jgi:hypothetical protein
MEAIKLHPDKPWDWNGISCNKFKYDPRLHKKEKKRKEDAARVLMGYLLEYIYRPGRLGYQRIAQRTIVGKK